MNKLFAGYAQVNIDPQLGIGITGYYVPRYAKGFLDSLEASALVLQCEDKQAILLSVDHLGIDTPIINEYRKAIAQATGVAEEALFIASTHTHTGPFVKTGFTFYADPEPIDAYREFLKNRLIELVQKALEDVKPAKMGFALAQAPDRIAYIRRYKMKDGTTMTCPPIDDPNIDYPLGKLDQRVHILRFDQQGGQSIVLLNYGLHADTIGGELISGDWPAWTRKTLDKALDGVKCMCFVGAQGDVGSTNVHPGISDMNDTEISFDNEMKSPGMARFVGRALAGTVLQVYDKVEYTDVESVNILHKAVYVDANLPEPEQLPLAHQYKDLHDAGRDDLIPYTAMELTTVVAEAIRMCNLENGPDHFELELTGVQIGPVAMIGIPGEPFTDIGVQLKDTDGWSAILPCCIVNGYEGYFPNKAAFDEGGYEARASVFKAHVAERIVEGGKQLLSELRQ